MSRNHFSAALLVALFIFCSGVTMAQSFNAAATIINAISMSENHNLDFNNVNTNSNPTVSADPNSPPTAPKFQGSYTVSGGANMPISFNVPQYIDLITNGGGAPEKELYVVTTLYGDVSAAGATPAVIVATGSTINSKILNASGHYYFWIGGQLFPGNSIGLSGVPIPPTQNPGSYTGTVTITLNY